jgi:hypothetical protein
MNIIAGSGLSISKADARAANGSSFHPAITEKKQ